MKFEAKQSSYGKNFYNIIISAKIGTNEIRWLKNLNNAMMAKGYKFADLGDFIALHTEKTNKEAVKAIYTEVKAEMVKALKAEWFKNQASKQFDNIADFGEFDTIGELINYGDLDRFNADYTIADLVARMKSELAILSYREDYDNWANKAERFIEKWGKFCEENQISCNIPCHLSNYGEAEAKAEEMKKPVFKANQRISESQLDKFMMEYNQKYNGKEYAPTIEAVIVFSADNWEVPYSLIQRSYKISNCNTGYEYGKLGSCIVGNCLDGKDLGVRLDWYRWKAEYAYFLQDVTL